MAVVVQAADAASARQLVTAAGGRVTRDLPIVNDVGAVLSRDAVARLGTRIGVRVTPDAKVHFDGAWTDPGTPQRIQRVTRSRDLWGEGVSGDGVTVALIDTGVYADHADLQGPNGSRVTHCEDFTKERGTVADCASFGHGTFMAGLIAGNGASSNRRYMGAAPRANIVSVKVSEFDGSPDMSTLVAGIQWTVAFKDVIYIRALNLSLGSDSSQATDCPR